MSAPDLIYKIVTEPVFAPARGTDYFAGMPVDTVDGYIHFSTAAQLAETLAKHFAGATDVVLLAIKTDVLAPHLVWEPSRGGQLFPHLYAPMPLSEIVWETPLTIAADGTCTLPEAVR